MAKRKKRQLKETPRSSKDVEKIAIMALDNITEGILVLTRDFKIVWANKKIMELTKLEESNIIGNFCYEITHHRKTSCQPPDDICPIHEVLETGKPIIVLHTHFDKDNNEFYAEVSAYPIKDKRGEIVQFVHIVRNVTDRVKAEKALAEAKEYTDKIIKSMVDALIVVDSEAKIMAANPAMETLLGFEEYELIGKPIEIILAEKEISPFEGKRMKELIEKGFIKDYEMTYKTKSGEKIPVSFSGSVLKGKEGECVGIVGIARDIRLIKRLIEREKELKIVAEAAAEAEKKKTAELTKVYRNLRETQDMLIQAEKLNAVGQLASGVAHEVRNPLGIIIQGIDYLEKAVSPKKEDIVETLTVVKDNVNRANKIISALLDFSKASKLDLLPEDINSILESSLTLVKSKNEVGGIKIIRETKKDIPRVLADKNRLEQVFVNILFNAIQAMPEGGKVIVRSYDKELKEIKNGIGWREEDHFRIGERAVIVEIEDTGIGISEESLKKIFDPFFTTKGPDGGTGLGLSVTRNIIMMHKGLIDVKSQIGEGTKVTVTLKIA